MKKKLLAGLATGLFLVGMVGMANANLISNGSFENDAAAFVDNDGDGGMLLIPGFIGLTDWTITGTDVAWINNVNIWGLSTNNGDFFLDLTAWSQFGTGGVAQTVAQTVAGQSYTLSFDLGSSTAWGAETDIIATASAGATTNQFYTTATSTNQWDTFTMSFIADSATSSIELTGVGTAHQGYYIGLDNVSLTADPVPEPATMLLFGTGLAVLVGARIRRKKK